MVTKKSTLKGIIFVLVLVVTAMGYSIYTTSKQNKKELYVAEDVTKNDTTTYSPETKEDSPVPQMMEDGVIEDKDVSPSSPLSCEKDLIAKLKSDNTEYEKGRILVGFNKDVSFAKAQAVVSRYDLIPALAGVDEDSYESLRLLTVNVPTEREAYFVCLLKKDSSIRYTNVNILLFTKPI